MKNYSGNTGIDTSEKLQKNVPLKQLEDEQGPVSQRDVSGLAGCLWA